MIQQNRSNGQDRSRLTRRDMIRLAVAAGGGLGLSTILAACGATPTTTPLPTATKPAPTNTTAPAATRPATTSVPPTATSVPPTATKPAATPTPAAAAVKRGGNITFAWSKFWTHDPLVATTGHGALHHLYDALWRFDLVDAKTGFCELRPGLAESWDFSNPKSLVLKLRKGIKFHDGSDWNADVAKWNVDRMRTLTASRIKGSLTNIESVDIVDGSTIKINLKAADPSIPMALSHGFDPGNGIVSKVAYEKLGAAGYEKQPAGTGPFMVQEIVQDERTVLKRNPDYWRKDASGQQLPYLDTATFRVVRDNTVAYTEMKAGSVDCLLGLEAKYLKEVEANAELVYFPLNAQVNFTSGIYGFNMKRDAWKNKLVRQAFSYGIDRKALSDATGLGYSEPSVAPWAANHIGWDPAWDKSYAYDLTKAKSLMAQAGVKTPVELSFLTAPGDRTGEILQQMLEPVGFKIKIDPADAQTQVGRIKDGNWDVRNWGLGTRPDPALTWSLLKAALTTDNGYTNDKLDAVMAEAGSTFDEKVRAAKYGEGIAMLMDEAVMLTLIRRPNNLVYRKKYKGVSAQYIFADFSAASLG